MSDYRVVSSDNHIFEPPDLWTSWIEPEFREEAPRVVREDGTDWWVCNGKSCWGLDSDSPERRRAGGLRRRISLLMPMYLKTCGQGATSLRSRSRTWT